MSVLSVLEACWDNLPNEAPPIVQSLKKYFFNRWALGLQAERFPSRGVYTPLAHALDYQAKSDWVPDNARSILSADGKWVGSPVVVGVLPMLEIPPSSLLLCV